MANLRFILAVLQMGNEKMEQRASENWVLRIKLRDMRLQWYNSELNSTIFFFKLFKLLLNTPQRYNTNVTWHCMILHYNKLQIHYITLHCGERVQKALTVNVSFFAKSAAERSKTDIHHKTKIIFFDREKNVFPSTPSWASAVKTIVKRQKEERK